MVFPTEAFINWANLGSREAIQKTIAKLHIVDPATSAQTAAESAQAPEAVTIGEKKFPNSTYKG